MSAAEPLAAAAAIQDLQLVARRAVDGFLAGLHRDPLPSAGIELEQYRSYQPGDDLRALDWKVYARSDRFFVRQSEVERDIVVRFLVDTSASMGHRAGAGDKLDYARRAVAALALLAHRQGDRLALEAIGGETFDPRPLRIRDLLERLAALRPSGSWPPFSELGPRLVRRRRRELVVVVGDLWEQADEMRTALGVLRAAGHAVLVIHLLGRDEIELDHAGDVLFEDLETGDTVRARPSSQRAAYRRRLEAHLDGWRDRLLAAGIDYHLLSLDQPLGPALRELLLSRRRLD